METMEQTFCEQTSVEERERLLCLLRETPDERDFVGAWLREQEAQVVVCTGYDDDERHSYVCLIPMLAERELAHLYVSRDKLLKAYPAVKPITSYIKKEGTTPETLEESELDDEGIDLRAKELGLSENYDLISPLGTYNAVFEYLLSYAVADIGDCTLKLVDKDDHIFDQDFEDETLRTRPLGICYMGYRNPQTGCGFHESCYFELERNLPFLMTTNQTALPLGAAPDRRGTTNHPR